MLSPTKQPSTNDPDHEEWKNEQISQVQDIANSNGPFQSPIDLNINSMKQLALPALSFNNYSHPPAKMKITNSGHTVIVSAKWGQERPYISDGPLVDSGYVFSQMHFHWGESDHEGSEHTVEGASYPMEMHVVHFKSCYLTQESALREKDGMVIVVYFFKLQSNPNPDLNKLVDVLQYIIKPHTSARMDPIPLSFLVKPFQRDYFLYWGSVMTSTCAHLILWFVSREPIGINSEQLAKFRTLYDVSEEPMMRNFRETQALTSSLVFHISPTSSRATTLLPISYPQQNSISQPGPSHSHADESSPPATPKLGMAEEQPRVAIYREIPPGSNYPFSASYRQPLIYTADPQGCVSLNTPVGPVYSYAPVMVPYSFPEGNDNMSIHYGALNSSKTEPSAVKNTGKEFTAAQNYNANKFPTNKGMANQNVDHMKAFSGQDEMYLIRNMDSANMHGQSSKHSRKNVKFNRNAEIEPEIKRKIKTGNLQEQGSKVVLPKGAKLNSSSVPVGAPWHPHMSHRPNKMPESCKEAKYYATTDPKFSEEPYG